jgi:hypothetical protein
VPNLILYAIAGPILAEWAIKRLVANSVQRDAAADNFELVELELNLSIIYTLPYSAIYAPMYGNVANCFHL